jgi:hypothetical protein
MNPKLKKKRKGADQRKINNNIKNYLKTNYYKLLLIHIIITNMLTRFVRRPLFQKINTIKRFNSNINSDINNSNINSDINNSNTNLLQEVKEIKVNVDHTNYFLSRIYLVSCLTGGMALGEIVGTLLGFFK